jgi:hypothetical protein
MVVDMTRIFLGDRAYLRAVGPSSSSIDHSRDLTPTGRASRKHLPSGA